MGIRAVLLFYAAIALYFMWVNVGARRLLDARAIVVPVSELPGVTAARIASATSAASVRGAPRRLLLLGRNAHLWVQAAIYSGSGCEISHRTVDAPEHALPLYVALQAAPTDLIVTSSTPCVHACQRACCDCCVYTNASHAPPADVEAEEERLCVLHGCPCN
jgi:hypothetical protein